MSSGLEQSHVPECGEAAAQIRPIGVVRSEIADRKRAPKQGHEGAPDAWIEIDPKLAEALDGLAVGDTVIVITWLHQASRDVLKVYPRSDKGQRLTGVFATRSPDRPNPIGLHRVTIWSMEGTRLQVGPLEALDGTPVLDIKPAIGNE